MLHTINFTFLTNDKESVERQQQRVRLFSCVFVFIYRLQQFNSPQQKLFILRHICYNAIKISNQTDVIATEILRSSK